MVARYVGELLGTLEGGALHQAILGCTHYPLVEHYFAKYLPSHTRILSQPQIVADSLDYYLRHHPEYLPACSSGDGKSVLLTTSLDALPTSAALTDYRCGLEFVEV